MESISRLDGCVCVVDEHNIQDMIIVEPTLASFTPVRGNAVCICGAPIEPWGWRCLATPVEHTATSIELSCSHCHRVHARFQLGTRVHR
jgi:hypothetical protein